MFLKFVYSLIDIREMIRYRENCDSFILFSLLKNSFKKFANC